MLSNHCRNFSCFNAAVAGFVWHDEVGAGFAVLHTACSSNCHLFAQTPSVDRLFQSLANCLAAAFHAGRLLTHQNLLRLGRSRLLWEMRCWGVGCWSGGRGLRNTVRSQLCFDGANALLSPDLYPISRNQGQHDRATGFFRKFDVALSFCRQQTDLLQFEPILSSKAEKPPLPAKS